MMLSCRATCIEKRKEQTDRLDYVTTQLKLLTGECKEKIKDTAEQAETKVSAAMTDEIRKLSLLVDQFDRSFHSDPLVVKVYKEVRKNISHFLPSSRRLKDFYMVSILYV